MCDSYLCVSIRDYDQPFPVYEKPKVVGEYSVTKQKEVIIGRQFMRYLNEDRVKEGVCKFDLSDGYSNFEKKDELANEKLDVLLQWVVMNAPPKKSLKEVCCNADIICWRGLLTKIAAFPYEKQEGFRVSVVRFRSVVLLCEFQTEEKIRRLMTATKRELLMTYWGFKFEQYITLASPNGKRSRDTSEPVNNMEQFSVIFHTGLGKPDKVRIFSSAEVDCINSKNEYVELKTQREDLNESFWKFKSIKWWLQSFLVGIEEIVVGFRNNHGIVNRTQKLKVSELTRKKKHWSANVAFNFLHATLLMIKQQLNEAPELEYYLIDFIPDKEELRLEPLPSELEFKFLPDFFIKHFEGL